MHQHQYWNIWYRVDGSIDTARLIETGKVVAEWDENGVLKEEYNPETNPFSQAFFDSNPVLSIDPEIATDPPNWDIFKGWAATSQTIITVLGNLSDVQRSMIVTAFYQVGDNKDRWIDIINLWNLAIANSSLTTEEKQAISNEVTQVIHASHIQNMVAINDDAMLFTPVPN